jgi:DNA-directed RNA polymerase sigma subunit (sigma70/sigma32)
MEADILRKRMGLDDEQELTLKEIGERYSLSRERIRQLQEQALGQAPPRVQAPRPDVSPSRRRCCWSARSCG